MRRGAAQQRYCGSRHAGSPRMRDNSDVLGGRSRTQWERIHQICYYFHIAHASNGRLRVASDDEGSSAQADPEASMRYGSAPDRRARILESVVSEGFCSVGELATSLDVSEMTVRRDIARLEQEGRLRRVHGGITTLPREALSPSAFGDRAADMRMPKQWIAQEASRLLEYGATVGLDAGTTTYEIALILPELLNLTVATHSLPALNA